MRGRVFYRAVPTHPDRALPPQPSGQHRRRGARDEDDGPRRPAPGARRSAIPRRRRSGWRPTPSTCCEAATVHATLRRRDQRTASAAFAHVGAAARMVAAGARRAQRRGARGARSSGDVAFVFGNETRGPDQRGDVRLPVPGAHPGQPGIQLAQPRAGGAGRRLRAAHGVDVGDAIRARSEKARHGRRPRRACTPIWRRRRRQRLHGAGSRLRERWRRLFSRVPALEREEVNILRGLLKALHDGKHGSMSPGIVDQISRKL